MKRLGALSAGILFAATFVASADQPFVHPGVFNTAADFNRMKTEVRAKASPWIEDFKLLQGNRHDSSDWKPRAVVVVVRGQGHAAEKENYNLLYNDTAAAYAMALDWKVTGDASKAKDAVDILNDWGSKLTKVTGTSDKYLASGIYGYQLAVDGEMLRDFSGWNPADFQRFKTMMLTVFYPMNHDFLLNHHGAAINHYWANWDLANMTSMIAIGVLTDRRDIYQEAVNYYKHGAGNRFDCTCRLEGVSRRHGAMARERPRSGALSIRIGARRRYLPDRLESGRRSFRLQGRLLLKAAEYIAKYNLGQDVQYTPYTYDKGTQTVISNKGRGALVRSGSSSTITT